MSLIYCHTLITDGTYKANATFKYHPKDSFSHCHLNNFRSHIVMLARKTLVPKRGEVTGEWRRLHNEELHNLYLSPNIIWMIE